MLLIKTNLYRFPEGVPWVRYHGMYKDLHINIVQPGKDPVLGEQSFLIVLLSCVPPLLIFNSESS